MPKDELYLCWVVISKISRKLNDFKIAHKLKLLVVNNYCEKSLIWHRNSNYQCTSVKCSIWLCLWQIWNMKGKLNKLLTLFCHDGLAATDLGFQFTYGSSPFICHICIGMGLFFSWNQNYQPYRALLWLYHVSMPTKVGKYLKMKLGRGQKSCCLMNYINMYKNKKWSVWSLKNAYCFQINPS